ADELAPRRHRESELDGGKERRLQGGGMQRRDRGLFSRDQTNGARGPEIAGGEQNRFGPERHEILAEEERHLRLTRIATEGNAGAGPPPLRCGFAESGK